MCQIQVFNVASASSSTSEQEETDKIFYTGQQKTSNLSQTNSQIQLPKIFRGHLLSPHSFLAIPQTGHAST